MENLNRLIITKKIEAVIKTLKNQTNKQKTKVLDQMAS